MNFKQFMERENLNRVFSSKQAFFKPKENSFIADNPRYAYRLTGKPQIDDMIASGYVRAKEGKMRGGKTGETQWSQGHTDHSYSPSSNTDMYILIMSVKDLHQREAPVPVQELIAIHHSDGTKWSDVTQIILNKL
jgi:hypothetical protein